MLPHTKGDWANQAENRIKLEPWQCFILCCLFGWLDRETRLRRFAKAYVCVPRKNGKSIIAAGIGLYMFAADGEYGAEVYCAATTEPQAWEVFRPAKQMVDRSDRLREIFGITSNAKSLTIPKNGSRFLPVVGRPRDGAMAHTAIIDEYHEHPTDEVYDALSMGMGARKQPLRLVVTTAGSDLSGPCYSMQTEVQKMLDGVFEDDRTFGIIYTLDENDDWTTEAASRKSNPNFGVSIYPKERLAEVAEAVRNSRKQNVVKTKYHNMWVNAAVAWMNMEWWNACADPKLDWKRLVGEACVVATDVSSKIDITSSARLFKRVEVDGKEHVYAFFRHYLPEKRAEEPEAQHYQGWVHDQSPEGHSWITTTTGSMIDYGQIEEDVVQDINDCRALEFAFDPWNAAQLAQRVEAATLVTAVEVRQGPQTLSDPMKLLEALVKERRFHHNGDPVLTWMISNTVAKADRKDNIVPDKERAENKIDGVAALVTGLGRLMAQSSTPYTSSRIAYA